MVGMRIIMVVMSSGYLHPSSTGARGEGWSHAFGSHTSLHPGVNPTRFSSTVGGIIERAAREVLSAFMEKW
jgi:hypothetical protein